MRQDQMGRGHLHLRAVQVLTRINAEKNKKYPRSSALVRVLSHRVEVQHES